MLGCLIYISKATVSFTTAQLFEILEAFKQENTTLEITGVLVYVTGDRSNPAGRFMQVMEGEQEHIHTLYQKLRSDNRHYQMIVIHQRPIEKRSFEQWQMSFTLASDEPLHPVEGFIRFDQVSAAISRTSGFSIAGNYLKSFFDMIRSGGNNL